MRKKVWILFLIVLVFLLSGCGKKEPGKNRVRFKTLQNAPEIR